MQNNFMYNKQRQNKMQLSSWKRRKKTTVNPYSWVLPKKGATDTRNCMQTEAGGLMDTVFKPKKPEAKEYTARAS